MQGWKTKIYSNQICAINVLFCLRGKASRLTQVPTSPQALTKYSFTKSAVKPTTMNDISDNRS